MVTGNVIASMACVQNYLGSNEIGGSLHKIQNLHLKSVATK
jgi:hypothetical protein